MFGRNRGAKATVAETAGTVTEAVADAVGAVSGYVDPVAKDEKLRQRLTAALLAGTAARQQIRRQTGLTGLLRRLAADPVLRMQLIEVGTQLQAAQKRAKKARSRKVRNAVLFVSGVGMVVAAVPASRGRLVSLLRGRRDISMPGWRGGSSMPNQTAIEEEVEVAVPVSTAYNQWTQFEEFPRFMEGVDDVRQLDDTLLHWVATVAGKHAEWDAKILEQEPDRRITWESIDGKHTRGTVSFEEAGLGRSRIRLQMTYTPDGVTEKVGSAIGLDQRRIRGDLERFRDLLETRQGETGAWRGEITGGVETSTLPTT
jgi:uncharacterized membrane protein